MISLPAHFVALSPLRFIPPILVLMSSISCTECIHQSAQCNVNYCIGCCNRPTGAGKHPSTEQLTIFYAGTVNVYDDVPVDKVSHSFQSASAQISLLLYQCILWKTSKRMIYWNFVLIGVLCLMPLQAQAIMLLAGTESPWSANPKHTNLPGSGANPGRPFSTLGRMNHPMSRGGSPAPQLVAPYNFGSLLGAGAKLPNRPNFTKSGLIVSKASWTAVFLTLLHKISVLSLDDLEVYFVPSFLMRFLALMNSCS